MQGLALALAALALVVIVGARKRTTTAERTTTTKPSNVSARATVKPSVAKALAADNRQWTHERASKLELQPSRQYCGVIDGVTSIADANNVADELGKLAKWSSLIVWQNVTEVPMSLPLSSAEKPGRFWLAGTPAAAVSFARDKRITDLWSRPALKA